MRAKTAGAFLWYLNGSSDQVINLVLDTSTESLNVWFSPALVKHKSDYLDSYVDSLPNYCPPK